MSGLGSLVVLMLPSAGLASGPLSSPDLTSHLPRLQSAGEGEKPRGRTIAPPALSPPRHSMEMAGLDIFTAPSLFNLTWKVHRHSTALHCTRQWTLEYVEYWRHNWTVSDVTDHAQCWGNWTVSGKCNYFR